MLNRLVILVLAVGLPLLSRGQTPSAGPAPAAPAQVNPRAGDASDGKAFRILSQITKAIGPSILFEGRIARSVVLGRTRSGATSLCANCTDGRSPVPASEAAISGGKPAGAPSSAAATPVAPPSPGKSPLGYVLVMDTSNSWSARYEGGAFCYTNDEGFDQDDRYYQAWPAAGRTTITGLVGKLLWVCSPVAENQKPPYDAERMFRLLMRRSWTTYAAPIGDSRGEPFKIADGEPGSEELRGLAKSHREKTADWLPAFRPRYELRQDATTSLLTDAIAMFASSSDGFIVILDLRKLESKEAAYFWAPYDHGQRIVLDESDLVVDGGVAVEGDYAPVTLVEYPYLIVSGDYARFALSRGRGSSPIQMVVGVCEECP